MDEAVVRRRGCKAGAKCDEDDHEESKMMKRAMRRVSQSVNEEDARQGRNKEGYNKCENEVSKMYEENKGVELNATERRRKGCNTGRGRSSI